MSKLGSSENGSLAPGKPNKHRRHSEGQGRRRFFILGGGNHPFTSPPLDVIVRVMVCLTFLIIFFKIRLLLMRGGSKL